MSNEKAVVSPNSPVSGEHPVQSVFAGLKTASPEYFATPEMAYDRRLTADDRPL